MSLDTKYLKDPDSVLDYVFNWRPAEKPCLVEGENITTYTITADPGITVDKDSKDDGLVTVWLSGGEIGQTYRVACLINTDAGRTYERTIWIKVAEK